MSQLDQQIRATEERYRANRGQREERRRNFEALRDGRGGDWRRVDDPERVLNRLIALGERRLASEAMASPAGPTGPTERRGERRAVAPDAVPEAAPGIVPGEAPGAEGAAADPPSADAALLERILAENDLLGVNFLLKGALVSRSVGRVVLRRRGRVAGFGTGFLVSPETLLTNNHVLGDEAEAAAASVQFNFFEAVPGRSTRALEFRLRPDRLFVTDPALDFSLVAVETRSGEVELASRGWIPLNPSSGKAVVGERVNIIQHPGGEPQQVSVHQNRIVDVVGSFLHYSTDTNRGSSGSPVLNDQWEVAALHHSGVPRRDEQGRILLLDGTPWDGSDRDREEIAWVANEGARISRVVEELQERVAGDAAQRRLLERCFETCEYDLENLRLLAALEEAQRSSALGGDTGGPLTAAFRRGADGSATWVLPLTVRVDLGGALAVGGGDGGSLVGGGPASGGGTASGGGEPFPPRPPTGPPEVDQNALRSALARLNDHADEPYYDEDADRADRAAYYPAELVDPGSGLSAEERFRRLHELLDDSHENRLSYKSARLDHLYPWVDLRPDRQLASIYSGQGFEPEEVIRMDLEIAAERAEVIRQRLARESFAGDEDLEEMLDALEAQMPFNCEHVVPQSWFGKDQPMKADLHHLFTCEPGCNSFRGNTAYFQFAPGDEAVRTECGRSEEGRTRFEPDEGKGAAARATLYFLLRYPGLVGDAGSEMRADRLQVLRDWHEGHPVDDYERHRNAAIFAVQGNRNPLIDFPELAAAVDFRLGFTP